MSWTCEHVNCEPLKPAASDEEYALHLAALEWSLAEPIVITGRADIKSEGNWKGRFDPYEHQVQNLITFCRRLPVTLLADDVGLGKTISAGLILAELVERKRVNRALVICPAILGAQWEEELRTKFGINGRFAKGADFDQYRARQDVQVMITTYDTARGRLEEFGQDEFDLLIMDEAHKLRNLHGSPKPPQTALRVRDALRRRAFKYVLMLTATPIQNRLWDLYSLIDLLTIAKGHRNPLGEPWEFQATYLHNADGRSLNPLRAEQFRAILGQYVVRTRREDAQLKFPTRKVETRKLVGTDVEGEMVRLVSAHIGKLNGLAQISLGQAMMSSPQALATQLENMAEKDGGLQSAAADARALADLDPETAKIRGLLALVRELRESRPDDWRVIVFTMRKQTQSAITRALEAEGVKVGLIRGNRANENDNTIRRFRADPPLVNAIVSTDAGAEGVNLQSGNVLVNYDLPWNPMVVEQRIGRVQRLGTKHEHVVVVNLVVSGSVEERVVARLLEKLQVISHTIGDIEAILASTGHEDEGSFEETIRKLVIASLKGVNVDEAAKRAAESVYRAKGLMESEKAHIDEVFGPGKAPEDRLRPPKVEPVEPSMRPEDFTMRALTAEGAKLYPRPDGTVDVVRPGKPPERITFKPEVAEADQGGVFMGNAPRLCLPGRPYFERLVQRWLQRGGHAVRDVSFDFDGQLADAAARWCGTVAGAAYADVSLLDKRSRNHVRLVCRAKAANGVDSLEKLVHLVPDGRDAHPVSDEVARAAAVYARTASPQDLLPATAGLVSRLVGGDGDVNAFCEFYAARVREEIGRCGPDPGRRAKLEGDLSPKVFAEVVGMSGFRYDAARTRVRFRLDGDHPYEADVELVPGTEIVLAEPPRAACSLTGRDLPEACLRKCDISGERAAAHLLVTSAESGRRALPKFGVTCAVGGVALLHDEVWESAITGKRAGIKHFKSSPASGRRGLAEDFAACEFTGALLLADELAESHVSGKRYRVDQGGQCAVTGVVGHRAEFVRCGETKDAVTPAQTGVSVVSGLRVRRDLLVRSDKPPGRLGLGRETVTCTVSGLTLLEDEVVRSAVSGRAVDKDLAATSDGSGAAALPDEVVCCEVSGRRLLPAEVAASAVSGRRVDLALLAPSPVGGRLGLEDEFAACEITGVVVLRDELVVSDESGKRFRQDQVATSAESGRKAHLSETLTCAATGGCVFRSEAAPSALTGNLYARRLLAPSEKPPGRLGLESEIVRCGKSGRRLLVDEVAFSTVSGRAVDRELLAASDRSGALALPEELITCAVTGQRLVPDETATSELSGRVARADLVRRSPVSGRRGLPDEFARCELTGNEVLSDELVESAESGRRFRRDQAVRSDESGLEAHESETVRCAGSGARILLRESGRSAISGRIYSLAKLRPSDKSPERLGTLEELVTCAASGRRLLRDEAVASAVSGKLVDTDLLVASDKSGGRALREEMVRCEVTGTCLLPAETATSDVSGRRVDDALLRSSPVSGRRGLSDEFAACEVTGAMVLRDELVTSGESGRAFRVDEAVTSDESGKVGHRTETVRCAGSGTTILRCESAASALSGTLYARRLLHPSDRAPGRLGLEVECVTCAKSGRRLLSDEVARSEVSGRLVDKTLLVPSALTRKLALPEEMAVCAKTRRRVLPDETVVCSVTGLRVARAKNVVGVSEVSGKPALLEQLVKCEATGKTVLPSELAACELTGRRVLPTELGVCRVSNRRVLRDRLLTSDLSGATVLPEHAVRSSVTKRVCLPTEAAECAWVGERFPKDEVSACVLTGLPVGRTFLNEANELRVLRDLLDGREAGVDVADLRDWLAPRVRAAHGNLRRVACAYAPDGRARAACAEVRTLLGMKVRHLGCLLSDRGPRHVAGRLVAGRRVGDHWEPGE